MPIGSNYFEEQLATYGRYYTATSTLSASGVFDPVMYDPYSMIAGDYIQLVKTQEKAMIKQLLTSNKMGKTFVEVDQRGRVAVYGVGKILKTKVLFVIDGDTIKANKRRTTHLKALLEKLAEAQGKTLIRDNNLPSIRHGVQVAYWKFVELDIDDSQLLTAKPREAQGEQPIMSRVHFSNSAWSSITEAGYRALSELPF